MVALHNVLPAAPSLLLQNTLTMQQQKLLVLSIFVPSALMKICYPKPLQMIWKRLPNWLWRPCGLYECAGAILFVTNSLQQSFPLGSFLLYTFLGGVLSSIVALPVNEQGQTLLTANVAILGKFGGICLFPALASIYLLSLFDVSFFRKFAIKIPTLVVGFMAGIKIQDSKNEYERMMN